MLKINFLGDSITEGAAASKVENTYVYLVGKMTNSLTRNYGIGGSRFAKQIKPSEEPRYDMYFASRVKDMDHSADLVFVFGGTNDYGHGDAPFGKMGDKTVDTFYGSIDYLVNELLKYYKKEQIIFIPPLYRLNEEDTRGEGGKPLGSKTLQEYRDAMIEVLKHYDIKVLDLKDKIGKPENNPLIADGLHPNDAGHHLLAELISEYIKHGC